MNNLFKIQTSFFLAFVMSAATLSAQETENELVVAINAVTRAGGEKERVDAENKVKSLLKTDHGKGLVNSSEFGQTWPIYAAVESGSVSLVTALINAGATVDRSAQLGKTPIALAIEKGNYEIARLILTKNPVDFGSYEAGISSLHVLALKMSEETAPFASDSAALFIELVRKGANHGAEYYDVQKDKHFVPLDYLLSDKITTNSPGYKDFVAKVDAARKESKLAMGFVEESEVEHSAKSTTPAVADPDKSHINQDD